MCVNIFIVSLLLVFFANNVKANSDEDYIDSVINMLLNGESFEVEESEENVKEQHTAINGGVWKCGNCADVDDSKLVYSENNDLEADITGDETIEVQISLSIPSMACVVVVGEQPGVVRRVSGACTGAHVTLGVAAANHFTVNVYSE